MTVTTPAPIAAGSNTLASVRAQLQQAEAQINQVVVGKPEVVRLVLACLLSGGHVLLEDVPGVGKTTLAHAVASSFALKYQRVQFTSDLLPSDLTGVSIFRADQGRFEFVSGPLFTELLLADELNRGSPKTQSALLEAMAEAQITVDGQSRALPAAFFVIATQNPSEQSGTFVLPESQLDRFTMTLSLGYPDPRSERLLLAGENRKAMMSALTPKVSLAGLRELQAAVQKVTASSHALDYVQRLIRVSRTHAAVRFGLSPRAGLSLLSAAKAFAFLQERDYVVPEDVQAVFVAVAAHRLTLRDSKATSQALAAELLRMTSVMN
jgi:MoxR-like ATPase